MARAGARIRQMPPGCTFLILGGIPPRGLFEVDDLAAAVAKIQGKLIDRFSGCVHC